MSETVFSQPAEAYAQSLRNARQLGHYALRNLLDDGPGAALKQLVEADFITSIEENLLTDPDHRDRIEVESVPRVDTLVNGQVIARNGEPMRAMLERGRDSAEELALQDRRMSHQLVRDEADLDVLTQVEILRPGEASLHISMDPKEALAKYPQHDGYENYREGLVYLQLYANTGDTMVAQVFSIDQSDLAVWREVQASFGVTIPDNETADNWVRHGLKLRASPEAAADIARQMRAAYYKRLQSPVRRRSISQYMAANRDLASAYFEGQYVELCKAIASRQTNHTVKDLAAALQTKASIAPEMRRQFVAIANCLTFNDDDGRLLDGAIRYGIVEQLRAGLGAYLSGSSVTVLPADVSYGNHIPPAIQMQVMNEILARSVQTGAAADRSYGGCAASFNPSARQENSWMAGNTGPQASYGGVDKIEKSISSEGGACEYSHSGCYCCPYDDDGQPVSYKQTVRAKRDAKGTAVCLRSGCGAAIDARGKTISIGQIAKKARQRQTAPKAV